MFTNKKISGSKLDVKNGSIILCYMKCGAMKYKGYLINNECPQYDSINSFRDMLIRKFWNLNLIQKKV